MTVTADLDATRTVGRTGGVLVIDDEQATRDLVSMELGFEGLQVTVAKDGMEGLHLLEQTRPECIVLDLMMPGVSGLEVLDLIRAKHKTPVLLLTALVSEDNVVLGLRRGADDYVCKPFSSRELTARVHALIRRARGAASSDVLTFRGLMIDTPRRQVTVNSHIAEMTAKEFDLLAHMAKFPGRVFTRAELLRDVWQSSSAWQQESTVTEHIRRVRLKIEADAENPKWIQTVRGVGYRFERRHLDAED